MSEQSTVLTTGRAISTAGDGYVVAVQPRSCNHRQPYFVGPTRMVFAHAAGAHGSEELTRETAKLPAGFHCPGDRIVVIPPSLLDPPCHGRPIGGAHAAPHVRGNEHLGSGNQGTPWIAALFAASPRSLDNGLNVEWTSDA
jgi:hypothetical protein